MIEASVRKTRDGFVAASAMDYEAMEDIRDGEIVKGRFVRERNGKFFRKWWALIGIAFEAWAENAPTMEYKGRAVLPDRDRFRKDITILAGFYRPVWNTKGELRLEAESLQLASMSEERFEALYSVTIDVILQKILPGRGYDEATLRSMVEQVLGFV